MSFQISHSRSWFTLVELIVGMTIFAIGLTGIYALFASTIGNATYSRHEIIVANLLREQMELIKNIRDTNVRNFLPWDTVFTEWTTSSRFNSGIYIVENDFSNPKIGIDSSGSITTSPVYLKDITAQFSADFSDANHFNQSALFLDNQERYSHTVSWSGTPYASYMIITPIQFIDRAGTVVKIENWSSPKPQWYTIDARVIVNSRGIYREYDAKTMITDWIK